MAQSAVLSKLEFTLNGNLHELEQLVDEIAWFCEENSLGSEVEFDLNLAMEELFTNALRHGGCEGMTDAIRIRLERLEEFVEAQFSDQGKKFDPAASPVPDLAAPLADRAAGGLGLHLVRRTMSGLQYRWDGQWNHITMRRPL